MSKDKDNSPNCNVVCSISSYSETRSSSNTKTVSYDPSAYIQKARATRAAPPKPAYDPLQFVQSKPCNLVKSAQEQVKKVEIIKNLRDDKIDEPEEWQCNLDNWKSSRRKRVEHIIDRVVEVKKNELEEHNRQKRKSKTFNEMMEERNSRRHIHLPIYTDDESNDLSDLGINSLDSSSKINSNETSNDHLDNDLNTAIDLNEYTYEGAIEDYKIRISRAGHGSKKCEINQLKQTTDENHNVESSNTHNFEGNIENDQYKDNVLLSDTPKIDILKRKQMFEKEQTDRASESKRQSTDFVNTVSMRERLSLLQLCRTHDSKEKESDIRMIENSRTGSITNRWKLFETEANSAVGNSVTSPKESKKFSSSEHSIEEVMKNDNSAVLKCTTSIAPFGNEEDEYEVTERSCEASMYDTILTQNQIPEPNYNDNIDTDHEDSGVHTTDVSCSVSQTEDQNEEIGQHIQTTMTTPKCSSLSDFDESLHSTKRDVESNMIDEENFIQADSNDATVLDDALEIAFHEMDNMEGIDTQQSPEQEPIYHNIICSKEELSNDSPVIKNDIEPYYQVPKSHEPYYEVPKTKPIPLYENIAMFHSNVREGDTFNDGLEFTIRMNNLEPPKEKPPPPPFHNEDPTLEDNSFRRINSTNRIKNTIRSKRSSFLAIDTAQTSDDTSNELDVTPLSTVASTFHDDQIKSTLCDNYDFAESRDSGMSENHSRQSSDLFTTSSDDPEYHLKLKDNESTIKCRNYSSTSLANHELFQQNIDSGATHQSYGKQITQYLHSDETPILTNAEEETKIHYNYDKELTNYIPPPIPPAKPVRCLRCQQYNSCAEHQKLFSNESNLHYDRVDDNKMSLCESQVAYHNACNNINLLTDSLLLLHGQTRAVKIPQKITPSKVSNTTQNKNISNQYHIEHDDEKEIDLYQVNKNSVQQRRYTEFSPHWNLESARQTDLLNNSRNHHWLIQEAEQRKNELQTGIHIASDPYQNKKASKKSLPDSVIQTITQRVQNLGIGVDRRWQIDLPNFTYQPTIESGTSSNRVNTQSRSHPSENGEKILSVSGKKKCSHCNNELGRGAAMVIESLGLLYHIDCFKCCVCHTRLGDGFKGTDVRVRKYKLHCQNCFSSEDGVKFSCV